MKDIKIFQKRDALNLGNTLKIDKKYNKLLLNSLKRAEEFCIP